MATITAKAPKNNLIYGFAPYQAKPDEAYMNAAQVHHFKNILNASQNYTNQLASVPRRM